MKFSDGTGDNQNGISLKVSDIAKVETPNVTNFETSEVKTPNYPLMDASKISNIETPSVPNLKIPEIETPPQDETQKLPISESNTVTNEATNSSLVFEEKKTEESKLEDFTSEQFIEKFATRIASKVSQANESKNEKAIQENQEFWKESDDYWVCNPCLSYSNSNDMPQLLQSGKRGNFGYVSKSGKSHHVTQNKKHHSDAPLHLWCVKKFQDESKQKNLLNKKSEIAAKKIIRNALFCFKRSLGSEDFLALNEKDFLTESDSEMYNIATKNDSRNEFFRLRNVIFDTLAEKTKNFFSQKVEDIAVTLDKVTVKRTSYTVIMTYFFYEGKIHVILN